jgi:toxin CcdB
LKLTGWSNKLAKFDIYKYKNSITSLVIEVQADLLDDLDTAVIVPLISKTEHTGTLFKRLTPILTIENEEFVMVTTDIATVKRQNLEHCIGNAASEHEYDIINALDFLFQGF